MSYHMFPPSFHISPSTEFSALHEYIPPTFNPGVRQWAGVVPERHFVHDHNHPTYSYNPININRTPINRRPININRTPMLKHLNRHIPYLTTNIGTSHKGFRLYKRMFVRFVLLCLFVFVLYSLLQQHKS